MNVGAGDCEKRMVREYVKIHLIKPLISRQFNYFSLVTKRILN